MLSVALVSPEPHGTNSIAGPASCTRLAQTKTKPVAEVAESGRSFRARSRSALGAAARNAVLRVMGVEPQGDFERGVTKRGACWHSPSVVLREDGAWTQVCRTWPVEPRESLAEKDDRSRSNFVQRVLGLQPGTLPLVVPGSCKWFGKMDFPNPSLDCFTLKRARERKRDNDEIVKKDFLKKLEEGGRDHRHPQHGVRATTWAFTRYTFFSCFEVKFCLSSSSLRTR
ncbi:unnamed protein product [Ixodes pacificus]